MANYTSVTASNICDAAGNKMASGTVSFQATDAANQPLNFQVGGGGQVVTTPATAAITAGVIAGGFQVADSANTSPAGILYRITITDTTLNRAVVTYSLVTVTGTTFSLDTFSQTGAAVLPPTGGSVNGPLTVIGNFNVSGAIVSAGNNSFTGSNTMSNLNGVFAVDGVKYSGCPAAVTAAGTSQTSVVVIPSSGPLIDCPSAITKNISIVNYDGTRNWCNTAVNTGSCFGENWNYDDSNVYSGLRWNLTTNVQDLNGVSLAALAITTLKNATANGSSGIDGFSAEANSAGTLSGTFQAFQAGEFSVDIASTGGTITDARGLIGFVNTEAGSTTVVTNAVGVKALGCNQINAGNKPVNCYGIEMSDQTAKGSGRNYSFWSRGIGVLGFSASFGSGGLDLEDSSNVAHPFIRGDGSNNTILQAISTNGMLFQDSSGANQLKISSSGLGIFVRLFSQTAGAASIGLTSNPFGSLILGTAATNNFTFSPSTTTGGVTISISDPGIAGVGMGLKIANGTVAMTTAAIAAGACGATVNAAASGTVTSDSIQWAYSAAPAANPAQLVVSAWPTGNAVNFQFCNPTAASITPTAATLNWRVVR
jgi:hypothetical protein